MSEDNKDADKQNEPLTIRVRDQVWDLLSCDESGIRLSAVIMIVI